MILRNLQRADALYPPFFKLNYDLFDARNYLDKIQAAHNNNLCVMLTEKAEAILKHEDNLVEAEKAIQEVRFKLNNLKIDDSINQGKKRLKIELPEYFDTEASLEYVEPLFLDPPDAIVKLDNAIRVIDKAIDLTSNPKLHLKYNESHTKIEMRKDLVKL